MSHRPAPRAHAPHTHDPHAGDGPLRRLARRGWQPGDVVTRRVAEVLVEDGSARRTGRSDDPGVHDLVPVPVDGLVALLPTYVGRCSLDEHLVELAHLLGRLHELRTARGVACTLWIGMQHGPGQEGDATARLDALVAHARAHADPPAVVGLLLPGPVKVATTNVATALGADRGERAWLLLDDDVAIDPDALVRLWDRFTAEGGRAVVGARVEYHPEPSRWSHLRAWFTRSTQPPHRLPFGCCELVPPAVLREPVPYRAASDDGALQFRMIDPGSDEPFARLVVDDSARCHVVVPSQPGGLARRQRSAVFGQVVHVLEYPRATGAVYLRRQLFYGLWPYAPWGRGPLRDGVRRWSIKAVLLGWFGAEYGLLVARGAVGRPRRWYPGRRGDFWSLTVPRSDATRHADRSAA